MMSRRSAVAVGLLILGGSSVPFVVRATTRIEPEGSQVASAEAPRAVERVVDPVFGDWFALGSRCRARASQPGDVELEIVPAAASAPGVHTARFHMPAFHLSTVVSDERPGTSSECSLRLAVNPGAGFRIRDVRARTRLVAQRPVDSEVRLTEELKLGSFLIGTQRASYSAGATDGDIATDVFLGTDAPGGARHPELACSENKLVAFDFTWLSRPGPSKQPIQVDLAGGKTVDIDVVLEPCADSGAAPPAPTSARPDAP
jgi:hypothetical protein